MQKALLWWIPWLYLLISDSFFLRTYDSAQVKISLVQMGGICLLALWLCRLLDEGRRAFSRTDVLCLAPLLAYFGYGILSYLHAPYKFSSLDFFLRRIFYMTVALIIVREFNEPAVNRLTRILVLTTWVTVGYGFLQWFDLAFFPRGVGMGPDPFIWRGAFSERVFSTFGNPNFFADFLVIITPVLICQYLKTREFKFMPLIFLTLWDLYCTYTKGAWIGIVISMTLLSLTYAWFFDWELLRRVWKRLLGVFLAMLLLLAYGIYNKLAGSRWTSVNFRLFTWEGTWEMIMTQPLLGTGIGSFWVIYPAFRRPPIFHIEGKHNTETDHAEDEYLEVLFDEGILGFGIFLWLLVSTFVVAYRALGQLTGGLKQGQRAPPRAYDLLGYLIALQGMLAHNFFDVSLRFVSSGVYLGLLSGLVVNLSRGLSLHELAEQRQLSGEAAPETGPGAWGTVSSFLIWPTRLAAWGGLGWATWTLLGQFNELQGPLSRMTLSGEILQWWIAWGCFLFCVAAQLFIFARAALLTRNAAVPLVIGLMVWPLNLAWGFFRADVHHNIAIFFSKRQDWENAVKNYLIVGKLNPAFVMASYFKGNVFNDRFNMTKIYNPNWGDLKEKQLDGSEAKVPRDDFERAIAAYGEVRTKAPNYVQMHHQMGVLYLKRAQWEADQAQRLEQERSPAEAASRRQESERYMDEALRHFQLYRNLDPVFPPNYFRIGQIYMIRKQYDKATEIYRALIEARECEVHPPLGQSAWLRKSMLAYQNYAETGDGWRHLHETAEAYLNLGNAEFLREDLAGAERAYKAALRLEPKNENVVRNLQVVYNKAQSMGRLRVIAPTGGPEKGPPTFQLLPVK